MFLEHEEVLVTKRKRLVVRLVINHTHTGEREGKVELEKGDNPANPGEEENAYVYVEKGSTRAK